MKKILPIFLILSFGFVLRIYHLDFESLWYDEIFSAKIIDFDFSEIYKITSLDVHPPLYYFFLKIWSINFGNNDFILRLFSVFTSISSIIVLYYYLKNYKPEIKFIATALLAVSLLDIYYSREARMYSLLSFFILINFFSLKDFLESRKKNHLVLYILSSVFAIYTQNFAFLYLFSGFLYSLYFLYKYQNKKEIAIKLSVSYILIFISYLPWLTVFINQLKSVNNSFWIQKITLFAFGETLFEFGGNIALGLLFLGVFSFGIYSIFRENLIDKYIFLFWFFVPVCFVIFLSASGLTSTIFKIRFILPSLIPFIIITSIGLARLKVIKKSLYYVMLILIITLSVFQNYEKSNLKFKEQWREVSQYLIANCNENDLILLMVKDEFNKVGGSRILLDYYLNNKNQTTMRKYLKIKIIEDSLNQIDFDKFKKVFLIKSHGLEQNFSIDTILSLSHKLVNKPEFNGSYRRFSFWENNQFILEANGISKSIFVTIFDKK